MYGSCSFFGIESAHHLAFSDSPGLCDSACLQRWCRWNFRSQRCRIRLRQTQRTLSQTSLTKIIEILATAACSELGVSALFHLFSTFKIHDFHLHPHMFSLHEPTSFSHDHIYVPSGGGRAVNVLLHLLTCSMLRFRRLLHMITHTFGWGAGC